jgi:hypothetical protein
MIRYMWDDEQFTGPLLPEKVWVDTIIRLNIIANER